MTSQVGDLLASHIGDEDTIKRTRKAKDDQRRGSLHLIRALDHQLRLVGLGWASSARLDCRSRFLGKSEVRCAAVVVGTATTPLFGRGSWSRAWPPARSVSRPRGHPPGGSLPLLLAHRDGASTNLCSLQFMVGALGLRIIAWRGPMHRIWNDFKDAVHDCEAWGDISECTHILGLSRGPWQSCAWWRRRSFSAATSTRRTSATRCGWRFWGALAGDFAPHRHVGPGGSREEQHEQHWLWNCVKGCTDNRPTLTRWFEVVARCNSYEAEYTAHFLAILLALKDMGVYTHHGDVDLGREAGGDGAGARPRQGQAPPQGCARR